MLGKLSLKDIPYNDHIVMSTMIIVFIISSMVISFITYKQKWKFLWKEWFTSVDHKKVGIMYIIVSLMMFCRGFIDALMMRFQQAISSGDAGTGYLTPYHYDQIVTVHGVIMVLFMATPFIIGLMNIIIPLQIGARDLAFPFLNSLSFWLFMSGVFLINISLIIGEFAQTGWAGYPPLSSKVYSPGVGVDYWIWSLQISGLGTTLTAINIITTILLMRAPNMPIMKMPIFTWTSLCSSILILMSFPILTATIFLLSLDRYVGTHFFTNDFGGNMMMYVNLFWAWGHPEVYILILPIFGIFSEVVSTFSRKKLFGYTSLVSATCVITILSFCVWLHHFFTMGSGANVNAFFGIMTMIIAVPTGVKIFNWLFTMYKGKIVYHSSMLWTIGFIITFSIGGMSGVLLSIPGINYVLHNSLFLIAHFHNVIIGGVVFGCFAGINYWFPKVFGFKLNEKWGKYAFWFWITGFYIAFMPMYILGFMGMTRRLNHNIDKEFHNLLILAVCGVLIIFIGILCQIIQLIVSIYNKKDNLDITGDPWNGRTLEWMTSSPPNIYNFAIIPNIKNKKDIFWYMKQNNIAYINYKNYIAIYMPKNTCAGVFIGLFSFITGFAFIWYIWWLVFLGLIGIFITWILRIFNKDNLIYIDSKFIKRNEDKKFKLFNKFGIKYVN